MWSSGTSVGTTYRLKRPNSKNLHEALQDLWRAERRWELGSRVALMDAFDICSEMKFAVPDWARMAAASLVTDAFFDLDKHRQLHGRTRQIEFKRLQTQKHCQMFWAIKGSNKYWLDSLGSAHPMKRASRPCELKKASAADLLGASTNTKRVDLAVKLLPRDGPSNSFTVIEESLREYKKEVSINNGLINRLKGKPQYFLWDITFLRPNTAKLINIPYNQCVAPK